MGKWIGFSMAVAVAFTVEQYFPMHWLPQFLMTFGLTYTGIDIGEHLGG